MIQFPFNKNRFFCYRPSTSWPVVYKFQERQEPSIMSESDTIFNERDRRCAAVQLMLSTDPSYDSQNHRWIATNNRDGDENDHATSHLRIRLESQPQNVPGCGEECGDPLVQSGGRWQTLDVAAKLGAGTQVQRDPGLASEGVLRLCTFLLLAPFIH